MKVAEVMSRGVDPVDPAATVQAAATQMAELDVGAVLVGTPERIEGILTDRDIILRLVVDGRNPAEAAVRDVMSATIFSCREDDSVEAAFAEMRERQIRRMPVLDEAGRPIGIVTLSDLAKAVESPEQLHETLREISEPHRSRKVVDADEAASSTPAETEASPEIVAGRP
jgi:CBS domain-containing protein